MSGVGRVRVLRRSWLPSSGAAALLACIEAERASLNSLDRELEFVDYGAGTPDADRGADEMAAGVTVRQRIGDVCRVASKPPRPARLLFNLVREARPNVCLELGTCLGISTAYQAAALDLNGEGVLHSLEGAEPLADEARALLKRVGLAHRVEIHVGRFTDVLPGLLAKNEFGFAFVDGHHDEEATRAYFAQIRAVMRPGSVMVFDDVTWSPGMRRAWAEIRADASVRKAWTALGMGVAEFA